jgi:ABC-type multidrug transport system ATPase subunit
MHTAVHLKNTLSGPLVQGRTVILVTHHISLCLPITSHVIELSRGRILRQGSAQELRSRGELQVFVETEDEPSTGDDPPPPHPADASKGNEVDDALDAPAKRSTQERSGVLVKAEARAEGRVSMRTYLTYVKACGLYTWIFSLLLLIFIRIINIMNQVGPGVRYTSLCC